MEPGFKLQLTTAPAQMPVSVEQAKKRARVDTADDDDLFADLIAAATEDVEAFLGRALVTRTYTGFLDFWPRHGRRRRHRRLVGGLDLAWLGGLPVFGMARRVELPRPPLISVASITTYDDADVATVMDPAGYFVDVAGYVGEIVLRNGAIWPIPVRGANGIAIRFDAGYGTDPAAVPFAFKAAILLLVNHFYQHPDAVYGLDGRANGAEMPLGITDLLRKDRVWNL